MTKIVCLLISLVLVVATGLAQQKVAAYAVGKYGTDDYEHIAFWVEGNKRTKIDYSYGKDNRQATLKFLRGDVVKGDSCFVVQFMNGFTLFVKPEGLRLKVTDDAGKYNKTFSWEYEGPVNGIGTFCSLCAADDREAMRIIKASYLR